MGVKDGALRVVGTVLAVAAVAVIGVAMVVELVRERLAGTQ